MSRKKKYQKHVDSVSFEELVSLPSGDYPLDLDLTDRTSGDGFRETPLDISLVTDLVPVQDGQELTAPSSKRRLEKIPESGYLDVFKSKEKRIIHPDMDDQSVLDSFRKIRTGLIHKSAGKNFVLMVVSLAHDMGSTFTSVNIGAAFSYEGQKTSLLMDCNQQKPKLDKLFEIKMGYGLTDYIYDSRIDAIKIIYPTGINRMNFIPIGHRKNNTGEFLSSERLQEFIGILKRRYTDRYIILNAPPLEVSADAAILSEVVDYILIVVPYGKVSKSRINKAVNLLPKEKIAGIILNKQKSYVQY